MERDGEEEEGADRRTAFHAIEVDIFAFFFVALRNGWGNVAARLSAISKWLLQRTDVTSIPCCVLKLLPLCLCIGSSLFD